MEQTKHREACDSCHKRKVKCPAEGPGACMNCQRNGRVCIFSPRDEMGRPKRSRIRDVNIQGRNGNSTLQNNNNEHTTTTTTTATLSGPRDTGSSQEQNSSISAVHDTNSPTLEPTQTTPQPPTSQSQSQRQTILPTPPNLENWSLACDNIFLSSHQHQQDQQQHVNNAESDALGDYDFSLSDSSMFHLDAAGMEHQAAIERAEMEHMRSQSEHTTNISGPIPQISRPHTSSSNLDRSRAGDTKTSPQHMKGVLLGGAWEMPVQQQQQRRPGGFSRSQTWQAVATTQLQDSRENQQQHFTTPNSRVQTVISPQTTFETCVKLTSILFDLQLELGKTRSSSKMQGTFQSDNVFSAAASLCDVVEELIEESNGYNHQATLPKFVFPISESGAPTAPSETKNDGTLNMLGNHGGSDDMLSVHRWLLSSCGCAMIINIYDAFCESFKNTLDQSTMLLSAPSNTPDSGINIPTTTQTPSNSTSASDYHHVQQRRHSSNFQSQTTMFNTNRLIQLTVMDFHLSKLERVFDVAICQGFLGIVEGKKLMQELRETLENLMARVKATWRV